MLIYISILIFLVMNSRPKKLSGKMDTARQPDCATLSYKLVYEYVFTWSVMATQRLTLFVNISSYIQFCVLKVISKEA